MNIILFNNKLDVLVPFLIINILIAIVYLVIKIIVEDYRLGIINALVILLVPPIGVLFLFFSWIVYQLYFRHRKGIISLEELSTAKSKIKILSAADYQRAMDMVALEESLLISNKQSARKSLLDILKKSSISSSIEAIYTAIEHDDSEVAHYAASAVLDANTEFKTVEKALRDEFYEDKNNAEICKEYMNWLSEYLDKNVLPSAEQDNYIVLFEELVSNTEISLPELVTADVYYVLVDLLLRIKEYDRASKWASAALTNISDSLTSYKTALKYSYTVGDNQGFLSLLDRLKKSDIVLDYETVEMVRFYS